MCPNAALARRAKIAVEHGHFFEMRSDRLRRREARHSGANDDCVLQDWVAHFGYLHGQARLTPFGRVSSPLAETSHDAWRLGGGEITNLRSYRRRNPISIDAKSVALLASAQ